MIRAFIFDMFGTLVVGSEDGKAIGYPRTHELLKSRGVDISYDDFVELWFSIVDQLDRWSARTDREYPIWRVASEFLAVSDTDHTPALASEVALCYVKERFRPESRCKPGFKESACTRTITCFRAARGSPHLSTREYARIVRRWVREIGLDASAYGTHTLRRTKASLIYRRTKNLRAVQLLLGHTKLESTVRYLAERTEV
jgi:hypothetical protein